MEVDGAAHLLKVSVAKELAIERRLAADLGERHVLGMTVEEYLPADGVGGKVSVPHVRVDIAGDAFKLYIALWVRDVSIVLHALDGHVSMPGINGEQASLGNLQREIDSRAAP